MKRITRRWEQEMKRTERKIRRKERTGIREGQIKRRARKGNEIHQRGRRLPRMTGVSRMANTHCTIC
jgi:hypothetical protein